MFILFQVRHDYMEKIAETTEQDVAIRLGCIEIRFTRIFFSNVHIASDTLVIPPLETFQWSNKSRLWLYSRIESNFPEKEWEDFFC